MNRLLIDRDFEAGDEPVKLCVRNGVPVELRKQLAADLEFDIIGESVGFFRFDQAGARRLAALVADYVDNGRAHLPHEEAVRDLHHRSVAKCSKWLMSRDARGSKSIFPSTSCAPTEEVLAATCSRYREEAYECIGTSRPER